MSPPPPNEEESDSSIASEILAEIGIRKVRPRAVKPKKPKPKPKTKGKTVRVLDAEERRDLLVEVKKKLLFDIEARGGLGVIGRGKRFTVTAIVQSRPEFYQPFKTECINFIDYWKRLSKDKYARLLDENGVEPRSVSNRNPVRASKVYFATDLELDSESTQAPATPATPSPTPSPTPPRRPKANMVLPTGGPGRAVARAPAAVRGPHTPAVHTGMLLLLVAFLLASFECDVVSLCIAVTIPVNPAALWNTQCPFKVYSAEHMMGNTVTQGFRGEFFKGFIITMKVDPRDVLGIGPLPRTGQFEFVARITSSHQVTISAPLLDFHDRGSDYAAIRQMIRGGDMEEEMFLEALQNQKLEFEKLKVQNKMQYVLDFGPNVNLSSTALEIHRGKTEGILTEEAMPTRVSVEALGPGRETVDLTNRDGEVVLDPRGRPYGIPVHYKYFCGVLYWRVADLSQQSRKQQVAPPAAGTSAAEAMLERMNLGG